MQLLFSRMKFSIALWVTLFVANVGMTSSGAVSTTLSDASILADIRHIPESYSVRKGPFLPAPWLYFDIETRIAISRGLIPTVTEKNQYAIPPGSRCMQLNGYSMILTPHNSLIAVPSSYANKYGCIHPQEDPRLFVMIYFLSSHALFKGLLQAIPNRLPDNIDNIESIPGRALY